MPQKGGSSPRTFRIYNRVIDESARFTGRPDRPISEKAMRRYIGREELGD